MRSPVAAAAFLSLAACVARSPAPDGEPALTGRAYHIAEVSGGG